MEGRVTIARTTPVYKETGRSVLYQGRWVKLLRVTYLQGGKEMERHLLQEAGSGNGTYIVALTDDGMVVFNRQYRAAHGPQVEFPAGRPSPDEDPGKAALRELLEETGYSSDNATLLAFGPALSGTSTQITSVYLVRVHERGEQQLEVYRDVEDSVFDEDFIQTFLVPLEKAEDFIIDLLQKGLGDLKMLAALRLAMNYLQKSPTEYVKFWLKIWQNRAMNWLKNQTNKF